VIGKRIERTKLNESRPEVKGNLEDLLRRAQVLEPTDDEVRLAAKLERAALEKSLPLDSGESQLAAMVAERGITALTTGDKRAIKSFNQLLVAESWLNAICGRVRCLEQLVLESARKYNAFMVLTNAVCADREADATLSICFGCFSDRSEAADAEQGLLSYIADVRNDAPDILSVMP
jgi:hypothetical protein